METISSGLIITGGIVTTLAVLAMILGFRKVGIAAGSVAAGIQSVVGAIPAGSIFSLLTSLGMKGHFIVFSIIGALALISGLFVA